MIELLELGRQYGWQELRKAIERALSPGSDAAAMGRLLTTAALTHGERLRQQIGSPERYERPMPELRELAGGGYITRAEPALLIGECGTGKTHLATGLCVAACRQKRRVRFTMAANLVNKLMEASQHHGARRVLARWMRYNVIALDEVGYVPLAEVGAEFVSQVIAERAERATLIATTNLPFSEWTQVFPDPRPCKAPLDRITGARRKRLRNGSVWARPCDSVAASSAPS
jgi:hypothetical protein